MAWLPTLERLLNTPTAPYREHWMRDVVLSHLRGIEGVAVTQDRWGNISARLTRGDDPPPPVAHIAHLDHPGFLVDGEPEGSKVPVRFEGGVADAHFPGARIRLFRAPDDLGVLATITEMSERSADSHRNRRGWAEADSDPAGCVLGMWDLDSLRIEDDLLHGRAVDDLAGVALILETLERLAARSEPTDTIGLFTRAEETGFRGLTLLLRDGDESMLPQDARAISVEMSSARPQTPVGGGAVLRVGDATTVYDNEILRSLSRASTEVAAGDPSRRPLVRALMDGGSCEATALVAFGRKTAGLCLPLGNYHNMDTASDRISEEHISLSDAEDLAAVMTEIAVRSPGESSLAKMRERLEGMAGESEDSLRSP